VADPRMFCEMRDMPAADVPAEAPADAMMLPQYKRARAQPVSKRYGLLDYFSLHERHDLRVTLPWTRLPEESLNLAFSPWLKLG